MTTDPPLPRTSDSSAPRFPRGSAWWRRAPATALIGAATILVSAASWGLTALSPGPGYRLQLWLWNDPRLVSERLWLWQLVTANLVHRGILHLAINVFFVVWLGPRVEAVLGSARFAWFYLGAGVFAGAIYDVWSTVARSALTTGGASGCALAVATLHALRFPRRVVHLYGFIRVPLWGIVLLFVVSDLSALFGPAGALWVNSPAHLGGAGFAAGYWYLTGRRTSRE